jgi:hypothetical protein
LKQTVSLNTFSRDFFRYGAQAGRMTHSMGLLLFLEIRNHDGEIALHIPSPPYAIKQLSWRTLVLIIIQIIANFKKSTNLVLSSALPPWDDLVAGFLSLRTRQVTFLRVCVRSSFS